MHVLSGRVEAPLGFAYAPAGHPRRMLMRDVKPIVRPLLDNAFLKTVAEALDGSGPALAALPGDARDKVILEDLQPVPDDVALVLPTSGSTGRPKLVMLTTAALQASAEATHAHVGGPGQWLLALPLTHVAGWQVVVRSLLAGAEPTTMPTAPFTPNDFTAAVKDAHLRYTALVPTQLARILDDVDATAAASTLHGILVGGSAVRPGLLDQARGAGLRIVRTYGMTETAGGCVYDGVPLPGVQLELEDDGRIQLAGPMLAAGYLGRPELTSRRFLDRDGTRWLRTDDLGEFTAAGRLRVIGRRDDVIVTGGENVAPAPVEAVIASLPGVDDVAVVGVPHPEWGMSVVALVVGSPDEAALRQAVRTRCGRAAVPRSVRYVDSLPVLSIGKLDRSSATMLARQAEAGDA